MTTIGDIILSTRQFLSLRPTAAKAPDRKVRNPVYADTPPGGRYSNYHSWSDERKERLALHSSWVYSAIRKITLAALPAKVEVHRRQGEESEPLYNHPLEQVFGSPNGDMSREHLWWLTHFSQNLSGKAFWFLYPDQRGNLAEIWPMPHQKITPVPDESSNPDSLFSGFIYTVSGGREIPLPRENVVYLRYPDPFDPYGALSPLRAGSLPMVLDRSMASWSTRTFDERGGLPANIISTALEIDDGDFAALKKDLVAHIGKNLVTRGGLIEVERLGMTNEEAEYLSSRDFNKGEIYEVFGVPIESSTDGGGKEANRQFINNTIWPLLELLAGGITTQLARPLFGDDIFVQFSDIRPQDRALAVQEATQYWPVLSLNEARQERDMEPLPPFEIEIPERGKFNLWDEIPIKVIEGFMQYIEPKKEPPPQLAPFTGMNEPPQQNAPSMQDSASPEANQVQEEQQTQQPAEETPQESPVAARSYLPVEALEEWRMLATKAKAKGQADACRPFFDDDIPPARSFELATVLGLCQSVAEIENVFEHIEDYYHIKATVGQRENVPPERLALEDEASPEIQAFLQEEATRVQQYVAAHNEPPDKTFWDNEQTLLLALLVPFVLKWAEAGIADGAVILGTVGLGLDAQVNAAAANWANKYALQLAKGLTTTTRELAKARISAWFTSGQSLGQLTDDLTKIIGPTWRAELIAQTEITRALSEARDIIARETPAIKYVVWVTLEGACPICVPMNGKKKRPGGSYPGNVSQPAHPRCRCDEAFEV